MAILMFLNIKGGVAKSTSAVAVAERLADKGFRVLVVDADHQCAASSLLLGDIGLLTRAERNRRTLRHALTDLLNTDSGPIDLRRYLINPVSNIGGGLKSLSLMPGSLRVIDLLGGVARNQLSNSEIRRRLRKRCPAIRKWIVNRFDYTIVDCPPSLPIQVRFFLDIADGYIAPCVPDDLSIRGTHVLVDLLDRLQYTEKVEAIGTLWTMYRSNIPAQKALINQRPYDSKIPTPFDAVIPHTAQIIRANTLGASYSTYTQKYGRPLVQEYDTVCSRITSPFAAPSPN